MSEDIKATLSQLARAINDELGRSERIGKSVLRLKELGYEFTLYLEATLILRKEGEKAVPRGRTHRRKVRSGSLSLSDRDLKFLKSLRISLEGARRARN